jgi:hypothetical protein
MTERRDYGELKTFIIEQLVPIKEDIAVVKTQLCEREKRIDALENKPLTAVSGVVAGVISGLAYLADRLTR